jgi:hypothetical protein
MYPQSFMDASRASVDEDISISMFTERTMSACDYDHPACVQKALNHLEDHKPIPSITLSAGRQNIDTYNLLSITLRLAPTSTGQTYIAAFIMSCRCKEDFVQFGKSLFWELFVPGNFVESRSNLWTVKACGGRTPAPTRTASRDSIPFIPQSSERETVRLKVLSPKSSSNNSESTTV